MRSNYAMPHLHDPLKLNGIWEMVLKLVTFFKLQNMPTLLHLVTGEKMGMIHLASA